MTGNSRHLCAKAKGHSGAHDFSATGRENMERDLKRCQETDEKARQCELSEYHHAHQACFFGEEALQEELVCLHLGPCPLQCMRPKNHIGAHVAGEQRWEDDWYLGTKRHDEPAPVDELKDEPEKEWALSSDPELVALTVIVKCLEPLNMKGQHERILEYLNARYGARPLR